MPFTSSPLAPSLRYEHTPPAFGVESALGWRGTGLGHPGHDCWTFPRVWVPKLLLSFTLVGVSMVATDLMQALHAHSGCRMSLLSPKLTFHFVEGDSVVKHPQNQRARNDKMFTGLYTAWNCAQFARNRRDVLATHPEYQQCWFSHQVCVRPKRASPVAQPPPSFSRTPLRGARPDAPTRADLNHTTHTHITQAEWSVYGYQCAGTIDHLPHEFKLLWHNSSTLDLGDSPAGRANSPVEGPGRSNCNLPSLCHRCRGRDGTRRPRADLMSPSPCGFCRCAGDLPEASYVTE